MKKLVLIPLVLTLSIVMVTAGELPDTNQLRCYDNTKRIPCPKENEAFYGQDAQYVSARSYTKLDSDGTELSDTADTWVMVKDNVTDLIWEVKDSKDGTKNYDNHHDADNTYTWYDPSTPNPGSPSNNDTQDFINALNTASFGGYSDWRMPTIKELYTLIDHGKGFSPYINVTYFMFTQSNYYWTSSLYAGSSSNAWHVHFYNGHTDDYGKTSSFFVRAVRSGQ